MRSTTNDSVIRDRHVDGTRMEEGLSMPSWEGTDRHDHERLVTCAPIFVVFGGDEQKALGSGDFALQPLDGLGRVRIVVLVVDRQVADLYLFERELRRRHLYDGVSQFAVERIFGRLPTTTAIWYCFMTICTITFLSDAPLAQLDRALDFGSDRRTPVSPRLFSVISRLGPPSSGQGVTE